MCYFPEFVSLGNLLIIFVFPFSRVETEMSRISYIERFQ